MSMNRLWNVQNRFQFPEKYKRVLCVCSAGLLRSPTTAVILAGEPFNFNTRAAGIESDHALIPVDDVLLEWADEIVVMTDDHFQILTEKFPSHGKKVLTLGIPDIYGYRHPKLVELIKDKYIEVSGWASWGGKPAPKDEPQKS